MSHRMANDGPGWTWNSVHVEGRDLYYRHNDTVSDKTPIVHLHGFAISGNYLMPTARRLAGRGLNIVPDLPGYGRSQDPRGATLGISELADRVVALIDALELREVVLLGNSMGCPIAIEVAHLAPERVSRLILVSPAGGQHNQPLPRALAQLVRDGPRERLAMFRITVPDYLRFGPINMLHLFKEMTQFPFMARLVRVRVPTLAVFGNRDPLMPPPHSVHEIATLAAEHVKLAVIDGAAHAINFSHPRELAHAVNQWLNDEKITDDPNAAGATWIPSQ